jgi:hypothetical protein
MRIHDLLLATNHLDNEILEGDYFDIELDDLIIESSVLKVLPDGIIIEADETAMAYLGINENSDGAKKWIVHYYVIGKQDQRIFTHKIFNSEQEANNWLQLKKAGVHNPSAPKPLKESTSITEAEYQGRKVPLGKPMAGDVKKSKVYVKGPSGRVVKVNFGDKKMKIKKSNPKRRKSFRARHNCANPGPRHKARFWSCRAWE